jgi:hypothetical protein
MRVVDPAGAIIPNATVKIAKAAASEAVTSGASNDSGGVQAIAAQATDDRDENYEDFGNRQKNYPPSEATAVIRKFNALTPSDKQAILDFLRSL